MGHGQVPLSPFFLKATCFPTVIQNLVSKYPDGKMGKMEVSGGIRKTGYFLGLDQDGPAGIPKPPGLCLCSDPGHGPMKYPFPLPRRVGAGGCEQPH